MEDESYISFIRSTVGSVWALELLLLMKGKPREWSVAALTQELRANTSLVTDVLETFQAAGLVAKVGAGYVFRPSSLALQACCDWLERTYAERPVTVVNLIVASAACGRR